MTYARVFAWMMIIMGGLCTWHPEWSFWRWGDTQHFSDEAYMIVGSVEIFAGFVVLLISDMIETVLEELRGK